MEDSGIDSDHKTAGCSKRIVKTQDFNTPLENASDSSKSSDNEVHASRQLQKRLEKRLVEGKHKKTQGEYKKLTSGQNLIPIQKLSIPSKMTRVKEQLPLVEWDTDESEEDVHFFPISKGNVKAELTDTFSIEEMQVSGDDDDDLDLLPPKSSNQSLLCCPFTVNDVSCGHCKSK